MYWANPSLNFDWCRWWEEKKRTVSVQDWERKAADFGGDEEKDSAPDWQQLDSSAQQQLLQGTHLCWSSSEEVDAQYTHHSLGSCFGYVGSSVVFFFFFYSHTVFWTSSSVSSTDLILWTTWTLCIRPRSQPLLSITLVHTQLLQVTVLRAGTPPLATALEQLYPRETHPWTPLIMAGM